MSTDEFANLRPHWTLRDLDEDDYADDCLDADIEEALTLCAMGEHEYELTVITLEAVIDMTVYECIHCGNIERLGV